jgi:hypothetical protein
VSLFLSSGGVKDNRKILLCKKSGGDSEIVHIQDKTLSFGAESIKKKDQVNVNVEMNLEMEKSRILTPLHPQTRIPSCLELNSTNP